MTTLHPTQIVDLLLDLRRAFHVGVPCSFLSGLISASEMNARTTYLAASSEAEAIGIAAGAWFGGQDPVVMMQSSGFCDAINPLCSLAYPFRIPLLLIVSARGAFGAQDEPQHELIGRRLLDLLAAAEIPARVTSGQRAEVAQLFRETVALLDCSSLPAAILVEKGHIEGALPVETDTAPAFRCGVSPSTPEATEFPKVGRRTLTRVQAIEALRNAFSTDELFVATTGYTGRELYAIDDSDRNLYLVGSMGCASAVGLGLTLSRPERVIVLDGDGAALMRMGNLSTIGRYRPSNLLHVILDNGQYESTGGQVSASAGVSFCAVALACGYSTAIRCFTVDQLRAAATSLRDRAGPSLIHVDILASTMAQLPRPRIAPRDVGLRLRERLAKASLGQSSAAALGLHADASQTREA